MIYICLIETVKEAFMLQPTLTAPSDDEDQQTQNESTPIISGMPMIRSKNATVQRVHETHRLYSISIA
jgi:hypothetical protein